MNWRSLFTPLWATLAAAGLTSCALPRSGTLPPAASLVWPSSPNEPRVAYVKSLQSPRDIGQRPSVLRTFADWITGDTESRLDLRKPFAVALDEQGNLCIADMDTQLVCYADFVHKKWRRYEGVGKTKFSSPVAVARRDGIFYVADSELAKVFAFRDGGQSVFTISTPLKRPVGLALAGGLLYVVDSQTHSVFAFSPDGKLQFEFGKRGTGPGEFNFPTCVAPDHRGHLLVADTLNSRVQVFDLRGSFVSQFGSNGDTSGHFARPKGVAVDAAGHIYVVDAVFDNFQVFDGAGSLLLNVGEGGDQPGEFGLPNGIAIGADNQIYVADAFNHRVQIFKYIGQP